MHGLVVNGVKVTVVQRSDFLYSVCLVLSVVNDFLFKQEKPRHGGLPDALEKGNRDRMSR